MTFNYGNPLTRQEMYREFGCDYETFKGVTSKRALKKLRKQREACDTADELLLKVLSQPNPPRTAEEAVSRVQEEYIAGCPSLLGWLFWQIIGSLISRIVFWLWDRYNS